MIIDQDRLYEISETRQPSKLIEWLHREGIAYKRTWHNRIFTTPEQINKAMEQREDGIEFE